ncbi:MAG TPA: ArsI/CadI family heavy metal resistance metalloenzyme [Blastocatellia bacterium]|nr:ArsI/CadI family heavy metal resistance metalloenzyme [Blastocatellia bacterium]
MSTHDAQPINTLQAHIAINVRDVEQSIAFYRKLFGVEPSKVRPGYGKFNLQNPPLNLTLNGRPFTDKGALYHLGIQVASTADVLAMRDRWQAAGLTTREEMQTVCGYALQDKSWVQDPDGNNWEVFVVHQDNLMYSNVDSSVQSAEPACPAAACCPTVAETPPLA